MTFSVSTGFDTVSYAIAGPDGSLTAVEFKQGRQAPKTAPPGPPARAPRPGARGQLSPRSSNPECRWRDVDRKHEMVTDCGP